MNKEEFQKKVKELQEIGSDFTCPNCNGNLLTVVKKEPVDKEYFKTDEAEQRCIVECMECKSQFVSIY